jgi:hypothetical protein
MDRRVIVLTPSEWEDRKPLSKCLSDAYQELHYAKTFDAVIDAKLIDLCREDKSKEDLELIVDEIKEMRKGMMKHIHASQAIVGSVSTVIDYKERQGTVS